MIPATHAGSATVRPVVPARKPKPMLRILSTIFFLVAVIGAVAALVLTRKSDDWTDLGDNP